MNAAHLRRLSKAHGYKFRKSPRPEGADNLGGYMLVEISNNALVAGDRYQLTLGEVEAELGRLIAD